MALTDNPNIKIVSPIDSVTKSEDTDDLIIEGYANTVTKDRAGDIILREAWETKNSLTNYLKNPIILAFHDHRRPIGKMLEYEVTDRGLRIKALISKSAGDVYELVKSGILTTFSVGFRIHDASYDKSTDTYYIKDVELHEVSVVSVPCNQDSTFSVAKSMDALDFERFKLNIAPSGVPKENNTMTIKLEDLKAQLEEMKKTGATLNQDALNSAVADATFKALQAQKDAEAAAEAADKKAAAEKAAMEASIKSSAREEAESLVAALKSELAEKDSMFSEMVKINEDKIIALKDEIAQVVASRKHPSVNHITNAIRGNEKAVEHEEADNLVILSAIKNVGMFETDYGKRVFSSVQKVNQSSNIEVSSASYETIFSTNLIRDIQSKLVIAPLFREIKLTAATLTVPIRPDRQSATWIAAAEVNTAARTSATTGNALSTVLTEKTLSTFKLAAKAYMTEETSEDAILSLVPILREDLVEAHANSIDEAFLRGSGVGQPKGLITQAEAVAANAQSTVTTAKADGSVKVTAALILQGRRKLGLYGIDLSNIVVIVSRDAYWDLLEDPEWADVQQVGQADALKLKGEVGNIYGMRVLVSDHFEAKAVSKSFAVLVNTTNFVVPRQRGLTMRSDFDVELDRRVFVATQRLNMQPWIEASAGNGKGVVSLQYAAA